MILATKTLDLINTSLERDGGAEYRRQLGLAIKECKDAFNPKQESGFREHLGASLIGRSCARQLWYSFRWATLPKVPARFIRLFNRGHLEEARFIALLRQAGIRTWHSLEGAGQIRIDSPVPHFGGSLDGIARGLPEGDFPFLLEFKTHGLKSFAKLVEKGVVKAKPEHYVQCCIYMERLNLPACLYCAVCKDNDELHLEIIYADNERARSYIDRADAIIKAEAPPKKINESAAWFECKFCDHADLCHRGAVPNPTCRSCGHGEPHKDGWLCYYHIQFVAPEEQEKGCGDYVRGTW